MTVDDENPLTWAFTGFSTIHSPYYINERKNCLLRTTLGEENP